MTELAFEIVDFSQYKHKLAVIELLNDYMLDDMGSGKPFAPAMHDKVLRDLAAHPSYIGFLLKSKTTYVALANCFVNYSTFRANHLLNIHDYVVLSTERGKGYGEGLLNRIISYSVKEAYCRINLEVREDNIKAKSLYQKLGFMACQPDMKFWEKNL